MIKVNSHLVFLFIRVLWEVGKERKQNKEMPPPNTLRIYSKYLCGIFDNTTGDTAALFEKMIDKKCIPRALLTLPGLFILMGDKKINFWSGVKTINSEHGLDVIECGPLIDNLKGSAKEEALYTWLLNGLRAKDALEDRHKDDEADVRETINAGDVLFARGISCDDINVVLQRNAAITSNDDAAVDARKKRNAFIFRHGAVEAAKLGLVDAENIRRVEDGVSIFQRETRERLPDMTESWTHTFEHGWLIGVKEGGEEEFVPSGCYAPTTITFEPVSSVRKKQKHYWVYSTGPNFGKTYCKDLFLKRFSSVVVSDSRNMAGVGDHYQWYLFEELAAMTNFQTFKAMLSGDASAAALNCKTYGASFKPRHDAQFIVFANESPWEHFAKRDSSIGRKVISRKTVKIISERLYLHKLDGSTREDMISFLHPEEWTRQELHQQLRTEYEKRLADETTDGDMATKLGLLLQGFFQPWSKGPAAQVAYGKLVQTVCGGSDISTGEHFRYELGQALMGEHSVRDVLHLAKLCIGYDGSLVKKKTNCEVVHIEVETGEVGRKHCADFHLFWQTECHPIEDKNVAELSKIWAEREPLLLVTKRKTRPPESKFTQLENFVRAVGEDSQNRRSLVRKERCSARSRGVPENLSHVAKQVCQRFDIRQPQPLSELVTSPFYFYVRVIYYDHQHVIEELEALRRGEKTAARKKKRRGKKRLRIE